MALPVFMTADVAQILEFWIRSFAFFVALSFQEDLIQDKISQYYCSFAVFCFQWEFTAQYRPVLLRHFHVQVLSLARNFLWNASLERTCTWKWRRRADRYFAVNFR